jgi:hypothetical protein
MNAQTALARQAIQELAARYSDALNRRDWQAFQNCWMWESTYRVQGPTPIEKKSFETILAEMKESLSPMETFFQITHPGIIEVFGREGKARFPVTEVGRFVDGSKGITVTGFFEDEVRLGMDGNWHFEKRTHTVVHWEEIVPTVPPSEASA